MSRATIACKDDARPMKLLTVIVLLPLAGFLLNGLLGRRLGRTFVSVVGCGLPILAFLATFKELGRASWREGVSVGG